jgi:hypothetical protein
MWVDPFQLAGLATTRQLGDVLRGAQAIWREHR